MCIASAQCRDVSAMLLHDKKERRGAMSAELERLKTRFNNLFNEEGLTNIKFFIDRRSEMTQENFVVELNKIQDTIAAGDYEILEKLDDGSNTRKFNHPF